MQAKIGLAPSDQLLWQPLVAPHDPVKLQIIWIVHQVILQAILNAGPQRFRGQIAVDLAFDHGPQVRGTNSLQMRFKGGFRHWQRGRFRAARQIKVGRADPIPRLAVQAKPFLGGR
jgi:hypothetical protein